MIRRQFILDLVNELIVDNFAGGGGASTGIELAGGRHVDIAINHNLQALAMHQANHPQTLHIPEDVFAVDPQTVTKGRPVGLAWFSPDCKHFSKAKGGKPCDKRIRGLAWVMLHWVNEVRPRVCMLENVEEFQTWCPLTRQGAPRKWRKGWFFRCFVGALRRRGYAVEFRELRACDYGAPTIRKRLFLIARCDGRPIVWPAATHGAPDSDGVRSGRLAAWRTAAECIDWSIPCRSIFLSRAEGRALGVQRPLADNSMARFARGVGRYVLHAGDPFIVSLTHQGNDGVESIREPFKTITGAHRGEKALVAPLVAYAQHGGRVRDAREPMHTITASAKDQNLVLAVHVAKMRGSPRDHPAGQELSAPMHTVSAQGNHLGLTAAFLAQNNTGVVGHDLREPLSTIVGRGSTQSLVLGAMVKYYATDQDPRLDEPLHTVTTRDRFGLLGVCGEIPPLTPEMETKARLVAAFLRRYGVEFEGEFARVGQFIIWDIRMRMLVPRELFRAQGFPEDYIIGDGPGLTLSRTAQVRMVGNSVSPPLARAIVAANVPDLSAWFVDERHCAFPALAAGSDRPQRPAVAVA